MGHTTQRPATGVHVGQGLPDTHGCIRHEHCQVALCVVLLLQNLHKRCLLCCKTASSRSQLHSLLNGHIQYLENIGEVCTPAILSPTKVDQSCGRSLKQSHGFFDRFGEVFLLQ